MDYTKLPLPIEEQIRLLQSRGMVIPDIQKITHYLSNISYYRLSAYFHVFLTEPKENHIFYPNTSFDQILDTYIFDRQLRIILFDEIERIEIAFRSQLILNYSLKYGNNWYEDSTLFYNIEIYKRTQEEIINSLKNSKEKFIQHYRNTYIYPINPPSSMAIDITSFRQLSILYKNLKSCDAQNKIANHFGVDAEVLKSWLETLSFIRNICAHHARLWNRDMIISPKIPKKTTYKWTKIVQAKAPKLYVVLCIIQYLIKIVNPETHFSNNLKKLFDNHPDIPLQLMGIPDNWKKEHFWK